MATRAKKVLITNISHGDAEQAMGLFAHCNTQLKLIESRMEEEKHQIDNKYLEEITQLKDSMEEQLKMLQVYGQQYKDSWKGKSLALLHGKIGFRTGNPKLVKDKKFTWDAVTELLKKAFPTFVRINYEINKEALIAFRDQQEFEKIKESCYVDVIRDETFYAEANMEDLSVAYSIHR
ncbi:MAG TPA: host-nuclease inhibitor Gam family protein [Puia sp.]|jgi:phage host-nuclease inhibitor protein Gam|nr:host-nuclease inhibitor Gam family protein [Puia sp.]